MAACVFCRVLSFKPPKPCRNPPTWWIQKSEWRMSNKDPIARMTEIHKHGISHKDILSPVYPRFPTSSGGHCYSHPPIAACNTWLDDAAMIRTTDDHLEVHNEWRAWPQSKPDTARLSKTRQEQKPHMTSKDMPTQAKKNTAETPKNSH